MISNIMDLDNKHFNKNYFDEIGIASTDRSQSILWSRKIIMKLVKNEDWILF